MPRRRADHQFDDAPRAKRATKTRQIKGRRPPQAPAGCEYEERPVLAKRDETPLVGQTEAQCRYLSAMDQNILTMGLGPAGTGKTYCAAARAADLFAARKIDKIIVTRPAVEVGASMGFLPGTMEEKFEPYFRPFKEVLKARLGAGLVELSLKSHAIEAAPIAFLRGWTFSDAFVVLDEAQNLTVTEMKMFLTRIGKNCTIVINGDPDQQDVKGPSALLDAVRRLNGMENCTIIWFAAADIVRSGIVQDIVERYSVSRGVMASAA